MITKWTIKNFKSVSKKTELKFEPLTIFAGANSSGKSTVIQSLLLTAQTIQNPVTSRSVILNGHISKFGNFNDILSHNAIDSKEIELGFTLVPKKNQVITEYYSRRFMFPFEEEIQKLDLQFSFSSDENQIDQLNPTLNSVSISSQLNDKIKQKINIRRSLKTFEERLSEFRISAVTSIDKQALEYEVDISPKTRSAVHYYRMPAVDLKYIGVNLMHFLPYSLTGVYNELNSEISYILKILEGKISCIDFDNFEHEKIILNDEFKVLIIKIFEELVEDTKIEEVPTKRIVDLFNNSVKTLKNNFTLQNLKKCLSNRYFQRTIAAMFEDNKSEIERIFSKYQSDKYIKVKSVPLHLPEVDYIETNFKRNLKYLGPLRDEPKAIYPLKGYADSTDVGFKGENTAAVLEVHKNTTITYVPSSEFEKNNDNKTAIKETLQNAVLDWLVYLGVATNFKTSDKGKLGHELTVSTNYSNNFQDLTHVGVGVSQVLPILVLSLLANTDSTLIFEQPELHLHPKVQTRLADFFISLNLIDKQCIVETHSEYLINRLRYLVAISKGDSLSNNSILYFVEKEDSFSKYNEIRINKYGVIKDWPKGFFDESEKILLTERETEILEQLSKGFSNKSIADNLVISPFTVKRHIENIYQKLQTKNRIELVDKARKSGLI